jgi:hypothetical protein
MSCIYLSRCFTVKLSRGILNEVVEEDEVVLGVVAFVQEDSGCGECQSSV